MNDYKEQALLEYNSEATAAHPGGVSGNPFWNINASQFTFVPSFQFPFIQYCDEYRFTATDRNGKEHTFDADKPTASLAPIWADIPTGFVTLKVETIGKISRKTKHLIGARTFFKSEPFPGRDAYPPKARSYREASQMAFRYAFENDMSQHWLTHGTPKPDYAHNVYPSKTISSLIRGMIRYADLAPERAEEAMKLACNAADYLLSIRFPAGHPMEGLPPTYSFDGLDEAVVNDVARAAQRLKDTVMMIYPVEVGLAFLALAKATKDEKYFRAAMVIANFYKNNRTPKGSWPLVYDSNTGKPLKDALCIDFQFVDFFRELYEITLDEAWKKLSEDYLCFFTETCLKEYKWEGQFEDSLVAGNYRNLTHYPANALIGYLAVNKKGDGESIEIAKDLMRFVEDQFVVWGEFAYWSEAKMDERHTPGGLEQYDCYRPIDASTSTILRAFKNMYRYTGNRLYLEKAMALADLLTRRQDDDGRFPTFFEGENCEHGRYNFWINCHIHTAGILLELADLTEAEGIE